MQKNGGAARLYFLAVIEKNGECALNSLPHPISARVKIAGRVDVRNIKIRVKLIMRWPVSHLHANLAVPETLKYNYT